MHMLFQMEEAVPPVSISEEVTRAAINFVEVCCYNTAYISGHGNIELELM